MKFIGMGQLSKKLLYLIFCALAASIQQVILTIWDKISNDYLFHIFLTFICEIICGCFELINLYYLDNSRMPSFSEYYSNENDSLIDLQHLKDNKKKKIIVASKTKHMNFDNLFPIKNTPYFLLCLIGFLDFTSFQLNLTIGLNVSLKYQKENKEINSWFLVNIPAEIRYGKIIFICILCKVFLKYKVYSHQALGFIIIVIGFIVNFIFIFITTKPKWSVTHTIIVINYIIGYILFAVQVVWEKWIMETFIVTANRLMLIEGIFGVFLCIVTFIITPYIPCSNWFPLCGEKNRVYNVISSVSSIAKDAGAGNFILYLILILTASSAYNWLSRIIIRDFSPTHHSIADCFGSFLYFFFFYINCIVNNKTKTNPFTGSLYPLPGYIIVIIGCLLYNEIIVLYFCELNYNTTYEIQKRLEANDENNQNVLEEFIGENEFKNINDIETFV